MSKGNSGTVSNLGTETDFAADTVIGSESDSLSAAKSVSVPKLLTVPEFPDMRPLGLLALGHLVVDINNGAIPALLPFLKSALSLSYTSTAIIVLMSTITSSLIQIGRA